MLPFACDDAMRFPSEMQDIQASLNLPAKTVGCTSDLDGNRAGLTYPAGMVMGYDCDAAGKGEVTFLPEQAEPPSCKSRATNSRRSMRAGSRW